MSILLAAFFVIFDRIETPGFFRREQNVKIRSAMSKNMNYDRLTSIGATQ